MSINNTNSKTSLYSSKSINNKIFISLLLSVSLYAVDYIKSPQINPVQQQYQNTNNIQYPNMNNMQLQYPNNVNNMQYPTINTMQQQQQYQNFINTQQQFQNNAQQQYQNVNNMQLQYPNNVNNNMNNMQYPAVNIPNNMPIQNTENVMNQQNGQQTMQQNITVGNLIKNDAISGTVANESDNCKGIEDVSYNYWFTKGLYLYKKDFNNNIEAYSKYLENIYDFKKLYIDGTLIPPRVINVKDEKKLSNSSKTYQISDRYKLIGPSRMTIEGDNWRNYLLFPLTYNETEFPVVKQECLKEFNTGKQKALSEAQELVLEEFKINLSKVETEFRNLFNFYTLYINNIMTLPQLAVINTPISDKKNGELILNEKIYTILKDAEYVNDTNKWNHYIIQSTKKVK